MATYKPQAVARQNDTTNSTAAGSRIETGWGFIVGAGSARLTESITYSTAFVGAPIVTVTYGGDQIGTTPSYGTGNLSVRASVVAFPIGVQATGFTVCVQTVDAGTWSSGQGVYYHWIAIGL